MICKELGDVQNKIVDLIYFIQELEKKGDGKDDKSDDEKEGVEKEKKKAGEEGEEEEIDEEEYDEEDLEEVTLPYPAKTYIVNCTMYMVRQTYNLQSRKLVDLYFHLKKCSPVTCQLEGG